MTECVNPEMKEQLPDLAAEKLDDASRARVMQHVESCEACTEEHEILRVVRTAQMPVPFINVSKIVRALPSAPIPVLAEPPWFRRASFQMAAAFLLVAGGLISVRQAGDRADIEGAQAAPHVKYDIALVAGLDEMSTDELTSLLNEVDNLTPVPVAEPEQFSPVTASSDNQGDN